MANKTKKEKDFLIAVYTDRNIDSFTRFYLFKNGEIFVEISSPLEGERLFYFKNGNDFKKVLFKNYGKERNFKKN